LILGQGYNNPQVDPYPTNHIRPVLSMHGTLDPITPPSFATEWQIHYNHTKHYFVWMPNAVHGTIFSTPLPAKDKRLYCGLSLLIEFVKNPSSQPNLSCLPETEDYTYQYDKQVVNVTTITGYGNLWDHGPKRSFIGAIHLMLGVVISIVIVPCFICFIIITAIAAVIMALGGKVKPRDEPLLQSIQTDDEEPEIPADDNNQSISTQHVEVISTHSQASDKSLDVN
jgi:hypothetical protein